MAAGSRWIGLSVSRRIGLSMSVACVLACLGGGVVLGDPPRPAEVPTTLSPPQLAFMDASRRSSPSVGHLFVSPMVNRRAGEMQKMFADDGPGGCAKALLEAYLTDRASEDFPAMAIALLARADFSVHSRCTIDSKLAGTQGKRKVEPDEKKLIESVSGVVDALLATKHPRSRDAAAELFVQVFSEGLTSQHATSGNGNRKLDPMPPALTARAAEFLGDEDPFVHALAEWAVHVNVANDNDDRRSLSWPGEDPPGWFEAWRGVDPAEHLTLDYARQAISLGMHRRGEDLLRLARDVRRRAEGKASWARPRLQPARQRELDAALSRMGEAFEAMERTIKNRVRTTETSPEALTACRKAWLAWRPTVRRVVMIGPDVDFDSIVYFKRYSGGAHLQPGIHDDKFIYGGDIYVQEGLEPTSPTRALIGERLPLGVVTDMDLDYEGQKVIFSRTDENKIQKIFSMRLDGGELTKLTEGDYDDCDPAWMPDGGFVFGSMRAAAGTMCASSLGNVGPEGASHTNIYRCHPDGTIRRLSYCKDDDCYPYVLNDGRVVYMRWDYQERGVDEIFSLWAVRPDGTGSDGFYRVHIPDSLIIQSLRDPRPVDDSPLLVATGGSHRSNNEGLLMLCNPDEGINNPRGMRTVTPNASVISRGCGSEMRPVVEGGVPYIGGYVTKPCPLSEKSFLTSYGFDMPQSCNFWVYYVDVWGNKELIHRDKLMEAVAVAPVRKRPKPPVMPDLTDPSVTYATCYVDDVYADLPGVGKGEVKALRIAQQMFWITRARQQGIQYHPLSNASECFGYPGTGGTVRVIGTVPVEPDGSAHFQVPAGVDVYFQAIDANHMAVQRMRTHVEFAPGEVRGCIGCHETKGLGVPVSYKGSALEKPAVRPTPPSWGDSTVFNYEKHLQPIWDAKCVTCHGGKKTAAKLDLTSKKDKYGFMQSYRSLFGLKPGDETKDVVWAADGPVKRERMRGKTHPWWDVMFDYVIVRRSVRGEDALVTPPKKYGAIRHPFARTLVDDPKHRKRLTDEQLELIMTWFDMQAPYFDTYMQQVRRGRKRGLARVRVEPFPPFGKSRQHVIHRPSED